MTGIAAIRRALISVSDKAGLVPFAQALASRGVEILSTGGSARALRKAGVPVKEVADHKSLFFRSGWASRCRWARRRAKSGTTDRRRSRNRRG